MVDVPSVCLREGEIVISKAFHADLHIHSYWSDGSCSPKEIVKRAADRGLGYICLTDVMNLGGWLEFNNACGEHGISTNPSLEIQTFYKNDWVELLLYGKNVFHKSFIPFLEQAKQTSYNVSHLYTGYLRSQGIVISKSEVDSYFKIPKDRTWSLFRINEYLRRVRNIPQGEVGRLIRNANLRHIDRLDIYREWLPRLEDVLHEARRLNILSCYAYPGVTAERRKKMNGTTREAELQEINKESVELKELGLDAIEVRYHEHSLEEEGMLLEHAKANNLIVIGGSGFHGDRETEHKPGIALGSKGITKTETESFIRKVS
jgi:3',5'-nucleoside bisphosphate phosphatase